MAQTNQHTKSSTNYTILVTFSWGDSSVARYCRGSESVTVNSETFSPVPQLTARFNSSLEGGAAEESIEVGIPSDRAPIDTAVLPYKHAAIKVKVEEFTRGQDSSRRVLFFGRVGKISTSAAYKGKTLAKVRVDGIKARLAQAKLGIQALTTCVHTFGDSLCGFDIESAKLTFIPTAVSVGGVPNRIQGTISGSPNMENSRWARGFLRYDKVSITIRKIEDTGSNPDPTVTIDLREIPPPSWLGKTVEIYPGCNKSIEACRDSFRDRESQFLGCGIAMLPYNPAYSDAPNA